MPQLLSAAVSRSYCCCQQLAADGHDGVRTGRSFYDWASKDVATLRRKNADKLRRILAIANE